MHTPSSCAQQLQIHAKSTTYMPNQPHANCSATYMHMICGMGLRNGQKPTHILHPPTNPNVGQKRRTIYPTNPSSTISPQELFWLLSNCIYSAWRKTMVQIQSEMPATHVETKPEKKRKTQNCARNAQTPPNHNDLFFRNFTRCQQTSK